MKKAKVAINGAGRIGRAFLKLAIERPELEVVAINDLADIENIAYLMRYDSAYGRSGLDISSDQSAGILTINGKKVKYLSERDPALLPWKDLEIDIVLESTGLFTSYQKASAHLTAGAKRVVLSAPAKEEVSAGAGSGDGSSAGAIDGAGGSGADAPQASTVLMGINVADIAKSLITSNASCTTNAASPLISILHEKIGIEKAILNTTHAYTASQSLVDAPNKKDWREGRAAAMNLAPSTTGAAIATTKVITDLAGKFDGISVRIPVVTGSLVDITFIAKRPTSVEEVNQILRDASASANWKGIFEATDEELVSRDIVGDPHASIADLKMTKVVDGNLVKVLAWYDNEGGYTHTLIEHVVEVGKYI